MNALSRQSESTFARALSDNGEGERPATVRCIADGRMKSPAQFIKELQQRKVFRALTLYCVTCWVLLQAASLVLPVFVAPEWVLKGFIIAAAVGLPIAAALAWLFELTSQGLVTDDGSADEVQTEALPPSHGVNMLIIGGL